ncbi:LysR substrate binding domain protein [Neisseria sp. oral taxon 020 str. F0370]|uniref:LysR family transcriptional regulator n=1 Tax=unclassified Neisseria TaxID=2623750 RepID=UPI0002A3ACE7|nr:MULTISPECIES: LysR family transcriptional regulator [unclassified Neisseria]ASP17284.1 LysR family transcriptional regulator [Neisseria sp. KEM232]EKY07322.1 LysR substrate binding domain protein [Neisseria sp. oral taxon 020 str. F0370]
MDTLLSLRVFCEVVRQRSFTRAADKLGISTAMASKHVSHLERHVRAKLLQRSSRSLNLTEAGEDYYRRAGEALDTLDTAAERAAGSAETPQGRLKITMPMWFANAMFCGWLAEYRRRYPQVTFDLILDNRKADLIAEGIDLALRVSSDGLPPGLIVRPLAEIPFYLAAAPEHLAEYGTPATPQEAAAHPFVLPAYTDVDSLTVSRGRERHTLRPEAAVRSDNTQMTRQMVLAGCGLGYLPEWTARRDLENGRLIRLLPDWHIFSATLYAAYPDRTFLSAKVRSFIDFLCEKTDQAV